MPSYLGDRGTLVEVNASTTICAVVFLAVLGPSMFILQPGYVEGLVRHSGLTEVHAGLVAGAETTGIAITAVLLNFVIRKLNWRILAFAFTFMSLSGNLLTLGDPDLSALRAARFLAGLGSGGLISLTFTMMGLTQRVDRNMGIIVSCVLTFGALGLLVLPTTFDVLGVDGLIWFLVAFSFAGFFAIGRLPCFAQLDRPVEHTKPEANRSVRHTLLAGTLAYNLAIGLVWVYLFLVGTDAGIAEQMVAGILAVSQFLGIAGALVAVALEDRVGRMIPLMISIVVATVGIGMVLGAPSMMRYAVGVCLFNTAWNITQPYVVATLAALDRDGSLVTAGVSMQLIGYAVGPVSAAVLLGWRGYDGLNSIAIVLLGGAAALIFVALKRYRAVQEKAPFSERRVSHEAPTTTA